MILDIENSLWKSDFDNFWQPSQLARPKIKYSVQLIGVNTTETTKKKKKKLKSSSGSCSHSYSSIDQQPMMVVADPNDPENIPLQDGM